MSTRSGVRPRPLPGVRPRPGRLPEPFGRVRSPGQLRHLLYPLLFASVITVPVLIPPIGANSVPADVFNSALIVLGAAVLFRSRERFRLPLGGSYLLLLTGGLIGVTQSVAPQESLVAVVQDAYLFVWFVMVVNVLLLEPDRGPRRLAIAWGVVGVAIALVVWLAWFGYPGNTPSLFGFPLVDPYGRSEGTFRDPNMAGNYLVLALFVLWAAPRPRNAAVKLLLTCPFLFGIYVTQSITALVTLVGGAAVAAVVAFVARREAAVAAGMAVVALALVAAVALPQNFLERSEELTGSLGETEVFDESLGRSNVSLSVRAQRWEEAFRFFGSSIILGIGPATTDETLMARDAPVPGEIHNDYMAGLLERGVLGALGNLMLFAIAAAWSLRAGLDAKLAREGWRPAALVGGIVVILVGAVSLETLHFRHVWLFLALVVALGMRASATSRVPGPVGPPRPRRKRKLAGLTVRRAATDP